RPAVRVQGAQRARHLGRRRRRPARGALMNAVRRIADAVLYEGYLLWPYRRTALKNQRRWTFGGVFPRAHSERHPDDRWIMRTECLLEGDDEVDVRVRFLQVVGEAGVEREAGPGPISV